MYWLLFILVPRISERGITSGIRAHVATLGSLCYAPTMVLFLLCIVILWLLFLYLVNSCFWLLCLWSDFSNITLLFPQWCLLHIDLVAVVVRVVITVEKNTMRKEVRKERENKVITLIRMVCDNLCQCSRKFLLRWALVLRSTNMIMIKKRDPIMGTPII